MRRILTQAGAVVAMMALAGCGTATGLLYGDSRLAEATAPQFGLAPNQIIIQNRQPTSSGSYYDVKLPSGQTVRCFHDGNAFGMGIASNPPRCGDQMGVNPMTGR